MQAAKIRAYARACFWAVQGEGEGKGGGGCRMGPQPTQAPEIKPRAHEAIDGQDNASAYKCEARVQAQRTAQGRQEVAELKYRAELSSGDVRAHDTDQFGNDRANRSP